MTGINCHILVPGLDIILRTGGIGFCLTSYIDMYTVTDCQRYLFGRFTTSDTHIPTHPIGQNEYDAPIVIGMTKLRPTPFSLTDSSSCFSPLR